MSPLKICENVGANLCSLVHFWVKTDILNHTLVNKYGYQMPTYHLPQTLAYPVRGLGLSPRKIQLATEVFHLDFGRSIWWHQVIIKSGIRFSVPLLKMAHNLPSLPYRFCGPCLWPNSIKAVMLTRPEHSRPRWQGHPIMQRITIKSNEILFFFKYSYKAAIAHCKYARSVDLKIQFTPVNACSNQWKLMVNFVVCKILASNFWPRPRTNITGLCVCRVFMPTFHVPQMLG